MVVVQGRVAIGELPHFVSVFATRGAAMRRKHGSRHARLFTVRGAEHEVVVQFEWESAEAFEAFLADPEVKQTMMSSGAKGPPVFTLLDEVAAFPA